MSAEESESQLEDEIEPTDGEMYEVGEDDTADADADADADGAQPSWSSLTVAALKSALLIRGLQTTGRKADLVARLEASQSCKLPLWSVLNAVRRCYTVIGFIVRFIIIVSVILPELRIEV